MPLKNRSSAKIVTLIANSVPYVRMIQNHSYVVCTILEFLCHRKAPSVGLQLYLKKTLLQVFFKGTLQLIFLTKHV